ncbi:MAG: hypothetical protein M1815_003631 [Lichina confinis]|nr:MAG: hypothetical protein M1815_003631 [Lichina confinis]
MDLLLGEYQQPLLLSICGEDGVGSITQGEPQTLPDVPGWCRLPVQLVILNTVSSAPARAGDWVRLTTIASRTGQLTL